MPATRRFAPTLPGLLTLLLLGSAPARAQAPILTNLSPVRNAVAAPANAPVAVTFDQPVQNTPATQQALKVFSQQRGGRMSGTQGGAATVSNNTIRFDPTYAFKPGETVFVTTTPAATATGGAPLARGHVQQFTAAVGGTGRGNFTAPANNANPAVGRGPLSVAVGDVDGDGDLDLLTANYNYGDSCTVSVRLNDSTDPDPALGTTPDAAAAPTLRLTPNPARTEVRIAGLEPGQPLTLLDATGRVVRTSNEQPETSNLDLKGLAPGLYLLRAVDGRTARLVVE